MAKGKKTCPQCNSEQSARINECSQCKFVFNVSQKKEVEPKFYTEPGQGRKQCPKCQVYVGAKLHICPKCNNEFEPSVPKEKVIAEVKYFHELGKGRKQCPGCQSIFMARYQNCPKCNFDFTNYVSPQKQEKLDKQKEKEEKKKAKEITSAAKEIVADKKDKDDTKRYRAYNSMLQETVNCGKGDKDLSPLDNAKRILGYGASRAQSLLNIQDKHHYWSHVDWNYVRQELVKVV